MGYLVDLAGSSSSSCGSSSPATSHDDLSRDDESLPRSEHGETPECKTDAVATEECAAVAAGDVCPYVSQLVTDVGHINMRNKASKKKKEHGVSSNPKKDRW